MRHSLRRKVALAFSAAAIVLLAAQALGVRALAESQEERLIDSIIADDIGDLTRRYENNLASLPPLDPRLHARVSQEVGAPVALPAELASLPHGTHEVMVDGREIHVAVDDFHGERIFRVYDYSTYERHFKDAINALMAVTVLFALCAIWIAFWVSGLLVRQVACLARQVQTLRGGDGAGINAGKYDEQEVTELAGMVNDYHQRMQAMIGREKEFTGNVSHELRTPLTAIRTSCELLEQDPAISGKSRQRLQQIERAAGDMQALIESLLTLAREESAMEMTELSLVDVINATLERYDPALAGRPVTMAVEIREDARILANRAALDIVLSNLVDNALRHTPSGTISFVYEAGQLRIEDTGCGISPADLPYVFERFYKASEGPGLGFGLGLAIVKKICDRYGWPIHIDSKLGAGTTVTLTLHKNFTNP